MSPPADSESDAAAARRPLPVARLSLTHGPLSDAAAYFFFFLDFCIFVSPSDSRCASLRQVDLQDQHRDQQEGRETRAVRLEVRVKKRGCSETWPSSAFADAEKPDDRKTRVAGCHGNFAFCSFQSCPQISGTRFELRRSSRLLADSAQLFY